MFHPSQATQGELQYNEEKRIRNANSPPFIFAHNQGSCWRVQEKEKGEGSAKGAVLGHALSFLAKSLPLKKTCPFLTFASIVLKPVILPKDADMSTLSQHAPPLVETGG